VIRTIIVDDHRLFSEGLKNLLEGSGHFQVLEQFQDGRSLLENLDRLNPELILLDIDIPGINGLDILERLRVKDQVVKIVMLSMHEENIYSREAASSGASAYLTKSIEGSSLIQFLLRIIQGDKIFPQVSSASLAEIKILSKKEIKILELIAAGKTSVQIADMLGISSLTVRSHRKNMMRKLEANSSAELISIAFSKGVL
jgi:DNA-binding NarL/FixJ family response regulator